MTIINGTGVFFEETLNSLLGQTLSDFELIVIDGGIQDAGREMLVRYANSDDRIKVHKQDTPGLAAGRNQALTMAKGLYCAVADSDDVSLPNRLETEVDFLDSHVNICVCGSWIKTFGTQPSEFRRTPVENASIKASLIFFNPLVHSTVMWRSSVVKRTGLKYRLKSAEDYDFWVKLSKFVNFANIPKVLVHYRTHQDQHSKYALKTGLYERSTILIRTNQIRDLGIIPTKEEIYLHQNLSEGKFQKDRDFRRKAELWIEKLKLANQDQRLYPEPQFSQVLAERNLWVNLNSRPTIRFAYYFLINFLSRLGFVFLAQRIITISSRIRTIWLSRFRWSK